MKARKLGIVLVLLLTGCAATRVAPKLKPDRTEGVRHIEGRPPLAVLARDGDPSASIAVAVLTSGIDSPQGAEVPVALAAAVEARLSLAGLDGASVIPGAEGFRVRALLPNPSRASDVVGLLTNALLDPIVDDGPEMATVQRKLAALGSRPLPDPALEDAAHCTGEPYAAPHAKPSSERAPLPLAATTLESWRAASQGRGRVAFAVVGAPEDIEEVERALATGVRWPSGSKVNVATADATGSAEAVRAYDASVDLLQGGARVTLLAETPDARRAAVAARKLGDGRGSLATRLPVLEPLARIEDVTGAAHVGWGCVRVTIDIPAPAASADPPVTLAAVTDLARQEIANELSNADDMAGIVRGVVNEAADPRDAAERLAYWTLIENTETKVASSGATAPRAIIGLGLRHEIAPAAAPSMEQRLAERTTAIVAELARAETTRHEPVGEVRVRIERGQSGLWILLASPCGTEAETDADAGSGSLAAAALAARARRQVEGGGAAIEEWVTADGVGLLVHGSLLPGESSAALARRVADLAARSFGAVLAEPRDLTAARSLLLSSASGEASRAFATLADAAAPGHPSWVLPVGSLASLARSSDETVRARLDALRSGPLRVAVLANHDASQGEVVSETLSAFLPHRGQRTPSCPSATTSAPARPGMYAVEVLDAVAAEAWLAFPIPAGEASSRASATMLASALAAPGGLLERALGAGLARSWGARVIGFPRAPLLAVRVATAPAALDAAVAETRALFDRLRQEGLSDADRALAFAQMGRERLDSSIHPEARLVALWRGAAEETAPADPGADAVRAFASQTLQNDALIIVVSRPPRITVPKVP